MAQYSYANKTNIEPPFCTQSQRDACQIKRLSERWPNVVQPTQKYTNHNLMHVKDYIGPTQKMSQGCAAKGNEMPLKYNIGPTLAQCSETNTKINQRN